MTLSPLTRTADHRQQFPALANKAYFNYGGQGVMAQQAIDAITQAHQLIQEIGPFSNRVNSWIAQEAEKTRKTIAAELGTTSEAITLTEDVSVGCNIALWGIAWQPGDHLLLSDCEHPGIVAAAGEIARRFGVAVSMCPLLETLNQGDPVEVIRSHLRPETRLVVISHILWNTGQVLPLTEIVALCHQQTPIVPVLVDAAQSIGVLPLNLPQTEVDFYAFTGHKWWCGAAGVGGLYVRPEMRNQLHPTFIGWRSITKNAQGNPTGWQPSGQRYEIATSDYPLYIGLRQAIEIQNQWGTAEARYARIRELSQRLWQQLSELPQIRCLRSAAPEAGLISFRFEQASMTHNDLVQALEQENFFLRTILDPDCVRACVHYLTLESEIDRLVEAIKTILARL